MLVTWKTSRLGASRRQHVLASGTIALPDATSPSEALDLATEDAKQHFGGTLPQQSATISTIVDVLEKACTST